MARLSEVLGTEQFYLAGGNAIAHYLGHRTSRDLDMFSMAKGVELIAVRAKLESSVSELVVEVMTDAVLKVVVEGVPVDLVRYLYSLLEPPRRC